LDKLTNMRAFTKVVSHGSFSKAAREMGLSRAAVSKYVIDLEIDLGVQLLNRTTQSAIPTEVGQRYYERCLAILADIEDAESLTSQFQVETRGVLRINAPMSFGTMYLGRTIAQFIAQHPKLQVHFILSDEHLDTAQEGFDVTIRLSDVLPSNLIARKIAPVPRVMCASPDYLDQAGLPEHPRDLRNHTCLSYGYLSTGLQWKLTGEDGEHWIQVPWVLCSNNGEVLRDAALEGRGIALLPTFIVEQQLQDGSLRAVLTTYQAPEMSIYALYPPTRYVPVKLRVFIDFLVNRLAQWPGTPVVQGRMQTTSPDSGGSTDNVDTRIRPAGSARTRNTDS